MSVRVVGQRLECSERSVTRCLGDGQDPNVRDPYQRFGFTRFEAFEREHLHGQPIPGRYRYVSVGYVRQPGEEG